MGLLDAAKGALGGQQSGRNPVMSAIMGLMGDQQIGGLSGLVQRLQQYGLGDQVASWIGKGENLPVSGGQLEEALGSEKVQQLAQSAGCSKEQISSGLAENLPDVIDRLTPEGQLPDQQSLSAMAGKYFSH